MITLFFILFLLPNLTTLGVTRVDEDVDCTVPILTNLSNILSTATFDGAQTKIFKLHAIAYNNNKKKTKKKKKKKKKLLD